MMRNEPLTSAFHRPETPDDPSIPPQVYDAPGACAALARSLAARGLHTVSLRPDLFLALNPAVVCTGATDRVRTPGLKQLVTCRPPADDTGGPLWFWWVWSISEDHAPVELQQLCPAADIETAAARLVHVLAVRNDGQSTGRP